jgi:cell division protein FtsB
MIKNVVFLFVVLAAVFVVYLPSYIQMQDLRNRNLTFEKRINDLESENIKIAEERDRLKNDPEYFEKIARERMGLIKDGEVVYKVLPPGVKKSVPVEETKKPAVVKKTVVGKSKKATTKTKNKTSSKVVAKSTIKSTKKSTKSKAKVLVPKDKKPL